MPGCSSATRGDHPRVCGENTGGLHLFSYHSGSPPRVRGKLQGGAFRGSARGITPACAGKTRLNPERAYRTKDHPRVCGENGVRCTKKFCDAGSPPRVRGKLILILILILILRITPACAGKTLRKWRISVVDPSPQPRSSLTSRRADASIGSQ